MLLNISFDQAPGSLPTGFVSAVNYVVSYFDHLFTDNITINIHVGYGEVNGQSLSSGALGESITYLNSFSYASIRSAMASDAKSGDDATALASLPGSDPIGGNHAYWVSVAEQRALGLLAANDPQIDGYVGFSNSNNFDYNRNDGITPGYYDFIGVVEHEFSEILGRVVLAGDTGLVTGQAGYEPLDLFDYHSAGVRRLVGSTSGYFSIDGGATNLDNFNTNSGGDWGDWAASAGNDSALAFSSSGVLNNFSGVDVRAMDILGYNRAPATSNDFNGDGISDIIWRYNPTGNVFDAQMNGAQRTSFTGIGGDTNWSVVGTGDFNGDGMTDILWRYNPTGNVFDAQMNGAQWTSFTGIGGDTNWSVVGTGDFNGDGKTDILWSYTPTGNVFEAQMNGAQRTSFTGIGGDTNWSVVGTGDFNGDGISDILWRYNPTGNVFEAQMNGAQRTSFTGIGGDTNWSVVGTGDFNGDGMTDILWRYNPTGNVFDAQMNGAQWTSFTGIGGDTNWSVVGTGDFNGDGISDILWSYNPTGNVFEAQMNGAQRTSFTGIGGDLNWTVVKI